jgi:hypothetical protein
MLVLGVGLGMVMQVLILAVQNAVDFADLGVATSSSTFFRQMGGSFGVAVFGAVLASTVGDELARRLPPEALTASGGAGLDGLLDSPERIRALPPPIAEAVVEALAVGIHTVFLWAVPVLVAGFVLAWFLRELPLRETSHLAAAAAEAVALTEDEVALGLDAGTEPAEPPLPLHPERR